jgi:hypothetical protein
MGIGQLLLVAAFVLFVFAAIGWPRTSVSLGWAGAACFVLSLLIG